MIHIEHLSKRYGHFVALDDVNLRIAAGEIFGFLGPNGAGKTTTIKLIAGLIKASAGDVHIDGMSVSKQPLSAKRLLGVVPDRPYLYEKLTGLEYLRFLCGIYQVPLQRGEHVAKQLLELFCLADWGNELVEGYSHGMKQRLVMAGAFIHDPKAMVIDEPMVGLDPQGSRLVKQVLKDYASRGRAIFLSTHSLDTAQELCDRIGIIAHGKLISIGTLDELRGQTQLQGDLEEVFMALTRETDQRPVLDEHSAATQVLDAVSTPQKVSSNTRKKTDVAS